MKVGDGYRIGLIAGCSVAVVGIAVIGLRGLGTRGGGHGSTSDPAIVRGFLVHGQVRGARSANSLTIAVTSKGGGTIASVRTTQDGHFHTSVAHPGIYALELRPVQYLSSTRRVCTVVTDETECDLDLPDTKIDLTIGGDGGTAPNVELYIEGPVSPTDSHVMGFVSVAESKGLSLLGVNYGTFSIVAFTKDGRTSQTPAVMTLSPREPTSSAHLEMTRRALKIMVQNSEGEAIEGALVHARFRRLEQSGTAFDASAIPSGMPLQVQAIGYVPSCLYAASQPSQVVTLERASAMKTYVTLVPDPGKPMGAIEGIPGRECGVDLSGFRLDQTGPSPKGGLRFGIVGLFPGTYRYRAAPGAEPVPIRVPGDLAYHIPPQCLICS